MLGIDLSTLSRPELQRLLKVALERGDGSLSERLEWELASRAKGGAPRKPPVAMTRPVENDPGEEKPREDLEKTVVAVAEPDAEPLAREPIASEPMTLEPIRLEPTPRQPAPSRGGALLLVGLVTGCLISGAVFWGLERIERPPAAGNAQALVPRAMVVRPLDATPPGPPGPPAPDIPAPVVPAAKPSAETAAKPAPPEETIAAKERVSVPPSRAVRLAEAEVTTHTPAQNSACARSTPADRLVCNDLALQLFDLQLQEAYRRALNARVDPVVVGEDQAAWRRTRDEVSDPQRLARLYNQRIHELDAATAVARENRPPG